MDSGLLVYGSAAKTNLEMIENSQRKFIRAISQDQFF